MQETEHYDLKKPSAEDFYNIADQNGNMDKLDAALHGLEEGKADLDPATGKVRGDQLPDMAFVPTSRKVNGKELSADINLTAPDVGARPSIWTPTAADVGAAPVNHVDDAVKHITATERVNWNGKASKTEAFVSYPADFAVDLNAFTVPGVFTRFSPSTVNKPPNSTAYGTVWNVLGAGADAYIVQHSFDAVTRKTHKRYRIDGAWSVWKATPEIFPPVSVVITTTWGGTGPWTQSIAVAGVLAEWDWRLGLHLAKITDDAARKLQEKAFACITWCETYDGGITLTCRDKKPDVAISAVLAGEV